MFPNKESSDSDSGDELQGAMLEQICSKKMSAEKGKIADMIKDMKIPEFMQKLKKIDAGYTESLKKNKNWTDSEKERRQEVLSLEQKELSGTAKAQKTPNAKEMFKREKKNKQKKKSEATGSSNKTVKHRSKSPLQVVLPDTNSRSADDSTTTQHKSSHYNINPTRIDLQRMNYKSTNKSTTSQQTTKRQLSSHGNFQLQQSIRSKPNNKHSHGPTSPVINEIGPLPGECQRSSSENEQSIGTHNPSNMQFPVRVKSPSNTILSSGDDSQPIQGNSATSSSEPMTLRHQSEDKTEHIINITVIQQPCEQFTTPVGTSSHITIRSQESQIPFSQGESLPSKTTIPLVFEFHHPTSETALSSSSRLPASSLNQITTTNLDLQTSSHNKSQQESSPVPSRRESKIIILTSQKAQTPPPESQAPNPSSHTRSLQVSSPLPGNSHQSFCHFPQSSFTPVPWHKKSPAAIMKSEQAHMPSSQSQIPIPLPPITPSHTRSLQVNSPLPGNSQHSSYQFPKSSHTPVTWHRKSSASIMRSRQGLTPSPQSPTPTFPPSHTNSLQETSPSHGISEHSSCQFPQSSLTPVPWQRKSPASIMRSRRAYTPSPQSPTPALSSSHTNSLQETSSLPDLFQHRFQQSPPFYRKSVHSHRKSAAKISKFRPGQTPIPAQSFPSNTRSLQVSSPLPDNYHHFPSQSLPSSRTPVPLYNQPSFPAHNSPRQQISHSIPSNIKYSYRQPFPYFRTPASSYNQSAFRRYQDQTPIPPVPLPPPPPFVPLQTQSSQTSTPPSFMQSQTQSPPYVSTPLPRYSQYPTRYTSPAKTITSSSHSSHSNFNFPSTADHISTNSVPSGNSQMPRWQSVLPNIPPPLHGNMQQFGNPQHRFPQSALPNIPHTSSLRWPLFPAPPNMPTPSVSRNEDTSNISVLSGGHIENNLDCYRNSRSYEEQSSHYFEQSPPSSRSSPFCTQWPEEQAFHTPHYPEYPAAPSDNSKDRVIQTFPKNSLIPVELPTYILSQDSAPPPLLGEYDPTNFSTPENEQNPQTSSPSD